MDLDKFRQVKEVKKRSFFPAVRPGLSFCRCISVQVGPSR